MSYETRLSEFREQVKRIEYQKNTLNSLIYWDKITNMPEKGIEYRAKVMASLGDQMYSMMTDQRFINNIKYLNGNRKNSDLTDAIIKRIVESSESINLIPKHEYGSYIELIAVSENIWEKAREKNDYDMLAPYLEQIFSFFKCFAEYWGYEDNPYDALMNYYVDGMTVAKVDRLVSEIKPFLINSLSKINNNKVPRNFSMPAKLKITAQEKLCKELLKSIGFDFDAGRVDSGAHPTVLANSPFDVRIVNNYKEDNLFFGLFNVLHSGGKGLYHQSIDKDLVGTFLAEVPSFALEEAVGRLYEDIVGRSKAFWNYFGETLLRYIENDSTAQYAAGNISSECYEYVNQVKESQIRIEADELSYLLHIIIRYELEKEVINNRLEEKDLPDAWAEKCKECFGEAPSDYASGILQDIHWAAGYVGYFPTYIYASLISAQLAGSFIKESATPLDSSLGFSLESLKDWLTKNLFKYGAKYSTEEVVKIATGKQISHDEFISYLKNKFSDVYQIKL